MNINPISFVKRKIATWKAILEPHWHLKENAIRSESHPLAGFWKTEDERTHGMAIGPAGKGIYYISFCGPGGCFKENTYRPNSTIIGDDAYKVIDNDTIEILGKDGYSTYKRSNE